MRNENWLSTHPKSDVRGKTLKHILHLVIEQTVILRRRKWFYKYYSPEWFGIQMILNMIIYCLIGFKFDVTTFEVAFCDLVCFKIMEFCVLQRGELTFTQSTRHIEEIFNFVAVLNIEFSSLECYNQSKCTNCWNNLVASVNQLGNIRIPCAFLMCRVRCSFPVKHFLQISHWSWLASLGAACIFKCVFSGSIDWKSFEQTIHLENSGKIKESGDFES